MPGIRFLFGDTAISERTIDELIQGNKKLVEDGIQPIDIIPKDYINSEEEDMRRIRKAMRISS